MLDKKDMRYLGVIACLLILVVVFAILLVGTSRSCYIAGATSVTSMMCDHMKAQRAANSSLEANCQKVAEIKQQWRCPF